jgi:nitroreductase
MNAVALASQPANELVRRLPRRADGFSCFKGCVVQLDSSSSSSIAADRRRALDLLLERHSPWPLAEPAPSAQELDLVFEAALRAPDHGQLQPWRFVVIRGDARVALGNVFAQAARLRDPLDDGERFRGKAMAAPVLIAICARVTAPHKVPESEQVLAVGAAAMNMLNALHLLGYGGFWATGANSHDRHVQQALGLLPADRLLGFLYVGTPKEATRAPDRHAPPSFVREWTGEQVARDIADADAAR